MNNIFYNRIRWISILCCILCAQICKAQTQNTRIATYEKIGWYNVFATVGITSRFGVHAEYQWRRADMIRLWQQSLLRVGLQYKIKPSLLLRVGYAWAETYAYGEYPINGLGKDFTEHRVYEMLQMQQKEGIADFTHRLMLEQRYVGRYSSAMLDKEDSYVFMNRARYMLRCQFALAKNKLKDKLPYIAVYDELFIGFGKNVQANIFDQNRIGILVGYKLHALCKIEAGYINQIIQFGRKVEGKNIFQYNNGFMVNVILQPELYKR